jgi:hypothetical protein
MWSKCAFTFVIGALLAAAFVGCGSDDEEQPPPPNTAQACDALCNKQVAANCQLMGMGLPPQQCAQLCDVTSQPGQCEARARAYIDCQSALSNVCDVAACQQQFLDVLLCFVPDAGVG